MQTIKPAGGFYWISDSGYVQKSDYEIEVYYLYPKSEKHKCHYEIRIPVEKLKNNPRPNYRSRVATYACISSFDLMLWSSEITSDF